MIRPVQSDISRSIARTAGLSSSWRRTVTTSPLRTASSSFGTLGAATMSPISASTGSKSSARHVQTSENKCRVTEIVSETPRPSSSSAICSAERVLVPRSMTRDSTYVAPSESAGSPMDPARMATFRETAGVFLVALATMVAPLANRTREGDNPRPTSRSALRVVVSRRPR